MNLRHTVEMVLDARDEASRSVNQVRREVGELRDELELMDITSFDLTPAAASIDRTGQAAGTALGPIRRLRQTVRKEFRGIAAEAREMAGQYRTHLKALGVGGILLGTARMLQGAFAASDDLEGSLRRLSATSKLTGTDLGFLQSTAGQLQRDLRVAPGFANDLTIELAKLASKAGDVSAAGPGMRAFLDIGAARGLDAAATLQAVQQSILGIDEGTDKLFGVNPSVLYERFAAKIGTTVGKLSDQQKAMALLSAATEDGAKVQGEFARFMEEAAGKSSLLGQTWTSLAAELGQALKPARELALDFATWFVDGLRNILAWIEYGALKIDGFFAAIPAHLKIVVGEAMADVASFFFRLNDSLPEWAKDILGTGREQEFLIKVAAGGVSMADGARAELETIRAAAAALQAEMRGRGDLVPGDGTTTPQRKSPGLDLPNPRQAGQVTLAEHMKREYAELDPVVALLTDRFRAGRAEYQAWLEASQEFATNVVGSIQSGLGQLAQGFGEFAVNAVRDVGGAFRGLLSLIANILGDIMITAGTTIVTTSLAFEKLKAALITLVPGAGIGAGLALIAAGAALKAGAGAFLSNPTGGGGGGGASFGGGAGMGSFNSAMGLNASQQGTAYVSFEGGLWDPSDPRQLESFRRMMTSLTGRRIVIMGAQA